MQNPLPHFVPAVETDASAVLEERGIDFKHDGPHGSIVASEHYGDDCTRGVRRHSHREEARAAVSGNR